MTTAASSSSSTSLQQTLQTSASSSSVDKTIAISSLLTNGSSSSSVGITKHSKYKNFIEIKEREEFLHKLKEFHKAKGSPINNYPTLNGKLIDLHALYQKVISQGGWEKVCEKEKWDEIAVEFNIPINCSNGSHALKMIYLRYLSLYEKIIFFGEDNLIKDDEEEDSRKKFNHILKSVPMTYNNNHQHHHHHHHLTSSGSGNGNSFLNGIIMNGGSSNSNICISPSVNNNNSIYVNNNNNNEIQRSNSSAVSNFERLENSLTSGLPNEVDFVFNTILILSNDDNYSFRINGTNTRLIDLILAHVGFFGDDFFNYRLLYDKWRKHNNRNFVKFWHDTVKTDNKDILKLLPVIYNKFLNDLPSQELLNLRQENGMNNVEVQRIEQAMVILNNLSFDENNVDFLSKSNTLFQYLLMSSYCTYSDIRKLSLDILSNICHKVLLRNLSKIDLNRLFYTIKQLLISNDRYEIIRGFEIITKLCLINDNEELITMNLDNDIYEIISQLLTVQDFLLLTYGLECLYELSQFSEIVCNQLISSSKSIISLLISYLTVDSTYFQSSSLKMLDIKQPKVIHQHHQTAQITSSPAATPQIIALQNRLQSNVINTSTTIHNHNQQQQQQMNSSNVQEQQARINLCNWFKNCFIFNSTYQISKTELYCYYKYIAKVNNWITFSIPTFFELLQQTFPLLKTDDNANTITGLKLVVNNIQSNINQNLNSQPSINMNPKPIQPQQPQQLITVNNVAIQQQQQQHQQIQIIQKQTTLQQSPSPQQHIVNINTPSATPPPPAALPIIKTIINHKTTIEDINLNKSESSPLVKTLQLNINESSSSSSVSTFSTTSSSSSVNNKEIRNSCDDDLNNIKENINFTKLNENLKINEDDSQDRTTTTTTTSSIKGGGYLDKLEKVGEAEPALNILCNNKNVKLSKIERLVNEVTIVKNGNGNGNGNNSESSDESSSGEEEFNRHSIKISNGIPNGNVEASLTNGYGNCHKNNDECDGIESKSKVSIKTEQEEVTITNGNGIVEATSTSSKTIFAKIESNGNGENHMSISKVESTTTNTTSTTTYINGYKPVLKINGENSNSSSCSSNELKINDKTKKRKKSTDSSKAIEENAALTPGKKRQKKINEMDIPAVNNNSKSDSVINKILVNNSNSNSNTSIAEQQQQQQPQPQQPPINTNNVYIQQQQQQSNNIVHIQQQYQQQQIVNNNSNNNNNNNNNINNEYICEWNNCKMAFPNAKSVYNHVFKNHLIHIIHTDNNNNGISCLWTGCDQVKRQKWALVSHLQERHCTEQALRNAIICRQKNMILQTNTPAINSQIAYSKDAAFYAIYRAQRPVVEDFLRMEDQSIAKSIRLLAALCLRNLSIKSPLAKRTIKQYESYLTNIAFDLVESSNAISNCLWQLTH